MINHWLTAEETEAVGTGLKEIRGWWREGEEVVADGQEVSSGTLEGPPQPLSA